MKNLVNHIISDSSCIHDISFILAHVQIKAVSKSIIVYNATSTTHTSNLTATRSLVKVELVCLGRALDLASVRLLQIALNDVVPVLPHRP